MYLIGHYTPPIVGNKLPSNKQVLHVLFFNVCEVKLSLRESTALNIEEASIYKTRKPLKSWKNFSPSRERYKCQLRE